MGVWAITESSIPLDTYIYIVKLKCRAAERVGQGDNLPRAPKPSRHLYFRISLKINILTRPHQNRGKYKVSKASFRGILDVLIRTTNLIGRSYLVNV